MSEHFQKKQMLSLGKSLVIQFSEFMCLLLQPNKCSLSESLQVNQVMDISRKLYVYIMYIPFFSLQHLNIETKMLLWLPYADNFQGHCNLATERNGLSQGSRLWSSHKVVYMVCFCCRAMCLYDSAGDNFHEHRLSHMGQATVGGEGRWLLDGPGITCPISPPFPALLLSILEGPAECWSTYLKWLR